MDDIEWTVLFFEFADDANDPVISRMGRPAYGQSEAPQALDFRRSVTEKAIDPYCGVHQMDSMSAFDISLGEIEHMPASSTSTRFNNQKNAQRLLIDQTAVTRLRVASRANASNATGRAEY
jgi:hypothetical protein